MPFATLDLNIEGKENQENIARKKRRASEGSFIKPKPVKAELDETDSQWKKLFFSLQQERVTLAERQLVAIMEESEARDNSIKNYVAHLEQSIVETQNSLQRSQSELEMLVDVQKKLDEAELRISTTKSEMQKLIDHLEAKESKNQVLFQQLMEREDRINMYKLITQTDIERNSEGSIECCVTNTTKNITTKFRLTKLEDVSMMTYEPVDNVEPLPPFLRQAIEFEVSDCPALLHHVFRGVFPDE
jgi:chromosome segregation ATPase